MTAKGPGGMDVELNRFLDRTEGAVWIYIGYNHHALKAANGELLAEITGGIGDVWNYNRKRYHGLKNAQMAAWADVRRSNDGLSKGVGAGGLATSLHAKLANCHPKLSRGIVWCHKCGREQRVDSASCFARGWPLCCGETMSICEQEKDE